MAAEKSSFGIAMVDSEGNLFKGSNCFSLIRAESTGTGSMTPDSRKGFYYNVNIPDWKTWTIYWRAETSLPMTDPFLIVVDTEGL